MNATINYTSTGEHQPHAERNNRYLKERIQVRARAQPVIVLGRHCSGIMPTTDVVTGGKRVLACGCVDAGKCALTLSSVAMPVSW